MTRITADKARDIARAKDPAFAVDTILADIAKAAEAGKYEYTVRDYGFGTSCYCNEKAYPELCKAISRSFAALVIAAPCRPWSVSSWICGLRFAGMRSNHEAHLDSKSRNPIFLHGLDGRASGSCRGAA